MYRLLPKEERMLMVFGIYNYVEIPPMTGVVERDVRELLCRNGKEKTFQHVSAVAEVCKTLAETFGLDARKCVIGGMLHDISAVIAPADMLEYALVHEFELCEAERKYPFLLHQRISEIIAEEFFGIREREVLSAIGCHTTLKAEPTDYEMVLFIADKLVWDQEGIPPFYNEVKCGLDVSLERACYEYMKYMNDNGKILCPHTNWSLAFDYLAEEMRK